MNDYKPCVVVCWWHEKPVSLGQYASAAEAVWAVMQHQSKSGCKGMPRS